MSDATRLSDVELRDRIKRAVNLCTRQELLSMHEHLPKDFAASEEQKAQGKGAPKVTVNEERNTAMELKMATTNPYGTGCYATRDFAKGDVISRIRGHIDDKRDFESLQIKEGKHLHMQRPEVFLNHNCDPNCAIDFESLELHALLPIKKGEQLTWNYNTSEWVLQRPFRCQCGAKIGGFKFLSADDQKKLLPWVSPYIRSQFLHGQPKAA